MNALVKLFLFLFYHITSVAFIAKSDKLTTMLKQLATGTPFAEGWETDILLLYPLFSLSTESSIEE